MKEVPGLCLCLCRGRGLGLGFRPGLCLGRGPGIGPGFETRKGQIMNKLIVVCLFLSVISCGSPPQPKPRKFKDGQIVYIKPDYRKGIVRSHDPYSKYTVRYYAEGKGYQDLEWLTELDLSETPVESAEEENQ